MWIVQTLKSWLSWRASKSPTRPSIRWPTVSVMFCSSSSSLKSVDTEGVEPLAHPLDAVQRLRVDSVTETDQREAFQALAPAAEAGLFLVPKVIE